MSNSIVPPTAHSRRTPRERPAPDWDQVYRRNFLERLKRDRPPVGVRGELPEIIARGYEDVPEEDLVRLHWWGLAHDKPKIGTFMVRVKVPGGRVSVDQLRGLGQIAAEFGRDSVELTTRQGVQLHWVPTDRLPDVLAAVERIGLSTSGAEGDTVRNVTSCPVSGLTAHELFDVGAIVARVAEFFDNNPRYANLPRKHKYTISACPAQCNAPEIADVALVGTLRDGRRGFGLRVGGGMSNTPRVSRDVGVFVPADDAVEVLRAVTDAWQSDLRYRMSRARARIKFMMDDLGPKAFRARVEDQLGRRLEDGAAPPAIGQADHLGVHPQRDSGRMYVGVPVPAGRVTGTQLTYVADLAQDIGAQVRLTRQQNLLIADVPGARLDEVVAGLGDLGLPVERGRAFGRSVACTSNRFCNYSVAETKDKLVEILDVLTARHGADVLGDLAIHLDGCPHACAQHWIGEIGLQGTTTHLPGSQERVEAYDLSLGGGLGQRTAVGRRLLRRIPTGEVIEVLDRLVTAWLTDRDAAAEAVLGFGEFCDAHTDEELLAIATGTSDTSGDATASTPEPAGVVVRLPGPLQRLVGGADEMTLGVPLAGETVGEVLATIGASHPEFSATVLPDGAVAGAFLITVADDDIRNRDGLATTVASGDVITLVMAMAGG